MLPDSYKLLLSPNGQKRFEQAYKDKRLPIGWGDRNHEAVGLLQVYLKSLGYDMSISVRDEQSDETWIPDGKFRKETLDAVKAFQRDKGLNDDGMVGPNTFDALTAALRRRSLEHWSERHVEQILIERRPRKCPPGALICPDPDAQRR